MHIDGACMDPHTPPTNPQLPPPHTVPPPQVPGRACAPGAPGRADAVQCPPCQLSQALAAPAWPEQAGRAQPPPPLPSGPGRGLHRAALPPPQPALLQRLRQPLPPQVGAGRGECPACMRSGRDRVRCVLEAGLSTDSVKKLEAVCKRESTAGRQAERPNQQVASTHWPGLAARPHLCSVGAAASMGARAAAWRTSSSRRARGWASPVASSASGGGRAACSRRRS